MAFGKVRDYSELAELSIDIIESLLDLCAPSHFSFGDLHLIRIKQEEKVMYRNQEQKTTTQNAVRVQRGNLDKLALVTLKGCERIECLQQLREYSWQRD